MNLIQDAIKLLGYGLCRIMPIDQVSAFGAKIGRYDKATQQRLDQRVRVNLDHLGWEVDQKELIFALRKESGRAALEMLMADRIAKAGRIYWDPHTEFERVVAEQRSIVFVTIHLSNLGDLTGAAIVDRLPHYRMGFVTRKIESWVDNWIATRCRNETLGKRSGWVLSGSRDLARRMVGELRNPPSCILLHIDEARHHQVQVPTFGRDLPKNANLRQAVRLAHLAGACLVPLVVTREPEDTVSFRARVLDVMDTRVAEFSVEDAIEKIDGLMLRVTRGTPSQWLQLYHLRY